MIGYGKQQIQDQPAAFFNAAYENFREAEKNVGGTIDFTYNIAGHNIRMHFAGKAMTPFINPALEHLLIETPEKPALRIYVWDSRSTSSKMLESPWNKTAYAQHGVIPGFNTDRIYTIFQPGENTLNILDLHENRALFWRKDDCAVPYYTVGAPIRSLFHWWMHANQCQLLHAAAVGKPEGGVLIVGKGGSGKSTAALSCLQSDLLYAGDDYTLLAQEPVPFVYSLYNTAKLDVDHIKRLPFLLPLVYNKDPSEEDKSVILLNRHHPEKICNGFPIKAILASRVTQNNDTKLHRCSPTAALIALAPSTIFQTARNREQSFRTLAKLVKHVPAYNLDCGKEIPQIPRAISTLLQKL